jgi:hypothetical protein
MERVAFHEFFYLVAFLDFSGGERPSAATAGGP